MSEKRFFICTDRFHSKNGYLNIHYKKLSQYETVRTVRERRFLFFKYNISEYSEKPVYETLFIKIPLLLYSDGEDFFEFFTKRYLGKHIAHAVPDYKYGATQYYSPSLLIDTILKWEKDAWIEEVSASAFFEKVKETNATLVDIGLIEKDFLAQINERFNLYGVYDHAEQVRRMCLAEEEKKRKALEAEQQRIREEEMARKALEEMVK